MDRRNLARSTYLGCVSRAAAVDVFDSSSLFADELVLALEDLGGCTLLPPVRRFFLKDCILLLKFCFFSSLLKVFASLSCIGVCPVDMEAVWSAPFDGPDSSSNGMRLLRSSFTLHPAQVMSPDSCRCTTNLWFATLMVLSQ